MGVGAGTAEAHEHRASGEDTVVTVNALADDAASAERGGGEEGADDTKFVVDDVDDELEDEV